MPKHSTRFLDPDGKCHEVRQDVTQNRKVLREDLTALSQQNCWDVIFSFPFVEDGPVYPMSNGKNGSIHRLALITRNGAFICCWNYWKKNTSCPELNLE